MKGVADIKDLAKEMSEEEAKTILRRGFRFCHSKQYWFLNDLIVGVGTKTQELN